LGWRAWVLSVGGGVSVGFFSFFKSYFGKRGGDGFKIYLYFLGLRDMGFRVLEEGVFGFFLLFWWKGVGVVVRFSFVF
jgi:hypothetical protein